MLIDHHKDLNTENIKKMVRFLITSLAVLALAVVGQSKDYESEARYMSVPMDNPEGCNLDVIDDRLGQKYMMCDPDNLLMRKDAVQVNWLLRDAAANRTQCPCSNKWCETNKGLAFTGYQIGVALVKKMKLDADEITGVRNKPREQAMSFAHELERERWNFGVCRNNIIIFYSQEDKELVIHAGRTATTKLTTDSRIRLMQVSRKFFNEGKIIEGLNTLIENMKRLLNCPMPDNSCELLTASIMQKSGTAFLSVSMATVLACALVTVYNFL